MCTLLYRYLPGDEYPLALLANRDETYDRPYSGWGWRGVDREFFAPLDQKAGGSWIGLGGSGVVVALTNILPAARGGKFRSRGSLVTDMLGFNAAAEAAAAAEREVTTSRYGQFNLLLADRDTAWMLVWHRGRLKRYAIEPGTHEVRNRPFATKTPKRHVEGENALWLEQMAPRLQRHPQVCKHGPGYGTRCSHKLLLSHAGSGQSRIWHLDGHPCSGKFRLVLPEGTEA